MAKNKYTTPLLSESFSLSTASKILAGYNYQPTDLIQEDRKTLANIFYNDFKIKYPHYLNKSCNTLLPKPKKPISLSNVNLTNKNMEKVLINSLQKSVLCGTACSDSSLNVQKNYANARMQNKHSTRQSTWFFWKWMVCLPKYNNGMSSVIIEKQSKDDYQTNAIVATRPPGEILGKLKITTKAHLELTALNNALSSKPGEINMPKKEIKRCWLNSMTDYFLMTVWLDDGGLHSNNSQGRIHWNKLPLCELEVFVKYLDSVWGVKCYVFKLSETQKNGQFMHVINIQDQESLLKFLRIVAPIIPVREMLYKVQFIPQSNADLLKRWASEVTELVLPEFREEMKSFYDAKISSYPS